MPIGASPSKFSRTSLAASTLAGELRSGFSTESREMTEMSWGKSTQATIVVISRTYNALYGVNGQPTLSCVFVSPLVFTGLMLGSARSLCHRTSTHKDRDADFALLVTFVVNWLLARTV